MWSFEHHVYGWYYNTYIDGSILQFFQPRAIISWPLLAFCLGGLFAIYDFQKTLIYYYPKI